MNCQPLAPEAIVFACVEQINAIIPNVKSFLGKKGCRNGEGRGDVRIATKRSVIEKLVEDYKPRWPALTVELIETELSKQDKETESQRGEESGDCKSVFFQNNDSTRVFM